MNKLAPFKFEVAFDYAYFGEFALPSIILTQEYNGLKYSNTKILNTGELENDSITDWIWNTMKQEFKRQIKEQKANKFKVVLK